MRQEALLQHSGPVKLNDDELSTVYRAAAPLDPDLRDQFLQAVAAELAKCDVVGPGVVYLVCRNVQGQFFFFFSSLEVSGNRMPRPGAASLKRAASVGA